MLSSWKEIFSYQLKLNFAVFVYDAHSLLEYLRIWSFLTILMWAELCRWPFKKITTKKGGFLGLQWRKRLLLTVRNLSSDFLEERKSGEKLKLNSTLTPFQKIIANFHHSFPFQSNKPRTSHEFINVTPIKFANFTSKPNNRKINKTNSFRQSNYSRSLTTQKSTRKVINHLS